MRARRRQATPADCAAALAAVLERALEAAGGRPAKALPRLATAFAAEQVAAAAAATGAAAAEAGEGGVAGAGHAGYDAMMQQALAQLEARTRLLPTREVRVTMRGALTLG